MEETNTEQTKSVCERLKESVENELEQLLNVGIQGDNLDCFGKLVDIHKDLENEDYWKVKKEVISMRYDGYEGYSDGYSEGGYGNYGRRGVPGTGRGRGRRYRDGGYSGAGDMIDKMHEHYSNYSESSEAYGRGNYGAKEDTMKSLDYMLKSVQQFMRMLEEDASSEEEMHLIKKYARKISEM